MQSFADLVSEHSQTEELVYGSPKKDYTANTAPSSSLKDNTIQEENSQEISKHKGENDSDSEVCRIASLCLFTACTAQLAFLGSISWQTS